MPAKKVKVKFSKESKEMCNDKIDELHEEMITLRDAREYNAERDRRRNAELENVMYLLLGVGIGVAMLCDMRRVMKENEEKMRLLECLESLEGMMKNQ